MVETVEDPGAERQADHQPCAFALAAASIQRATGRYVTRPHGASKNHRLRADQLCLQTFDLFTELDRTFDRKGVDQAFDRYRPRIIAAAVLDW